MRVAITFDTEHPDRACPPDSCERILDGPRDAAVRATFFVQGRWALAHPDIARRIARDGHLVGSHGFAHVPTPSLRQEAIGKTLDESRDEIMRMTGYDPFPWFRLPYLAGADDPDVLAAVGAAGHTHSQPDVAPEPGDWDDAATSVSVAESIVAQVSASADPAGVMLHSWPACTDDAVPMLVRALAGKGAEFVTVDQLA